MYSRQQKNGWALFLLLLAGIVIGGFIGKYLGTLPYLGWLNEGKEFGIDTLKFNFQIIKLQFGLNIYINIASILGVFIAIIAYKKL